MAIPARTADITGEGPLASGTVSELQQELRDLLCLAAAGDHIRWVLAGEGTAELARWLHEAAGQSRRSKRDVKRGPASAHTVRLRCQSQSTANPAGFHHTIAIWHSPVRMCSRQRAPACALPAKRTTRRR